MPHPAPAPPTRGAQRKPRAPERPGLAVGTLSGARRLSAYWVTSVGSARSLSISLAPLPVSADMLLCMSPGSITV